MKIAVIVLHFRNLSNTLECLNSLIRQDYCNFEIILVDNGPQDTLLVDAMRTYPHLHFIRNERNLGFAEGKIMSEYATPLSLRLMQFYYLTMIQRVPRIFLALS